MSLPFVDEHCAVLAIESAGICGEQTALLLVVESEHSVCPALRCRRFPHTFGAFDRYRGKAGKQLVELGVDYPSPVGIHAHVRYH